MTFPTSWIQLDPAALKSNLRFLRRELNTSARISSVVKGNAYGHGLLEFAALALDAGINHFSTFSADEAFHLHKLTSGKADLMIMGHVEEDGLEWAIKTGVSFFVFEEDRLRKSIRIAKKLKVAARIHVDLETGMNRTGFAEKDIKKKVIPYLNKNRNHFVLAGLCTHYAGAESIGNGPRIEAQIRSFNQMSALFKKENLKPAIHHTACSAAAMTFPQTHMDLARIGIMQYGMWPGPEIFIRHLARKRSRVDPLMPVMSWRSNIMLVKDVPLGEFIGYGTSYLARRKMKIAVVPVGYSGGYSRSLSNQGHVLVGGRRVDVVGNVNMNMLVCDITDVPEVSKGDEVVLIGSQGDQTISVASFAEFSNQLNYDLLSRLPADIPRIIKPA